jgi:hypothetical protein
VFEGVILGADLGLYGAHFASGMEGMLGKNYGMLEKVSRVARCISKLAYKCMRQ